MNFKQFLTAILLAGFTFISGTFADDTELYVYESSARTGAKSQVLIIFDNSGSMDKEEDDTEKFYPRGDTVTGSTRLYYSTSSMDIPKEGDSRSFLQNVNGCVTSKKYLENYGMFTGFFRDYRFTGQNGTWKELTNDGSSIEYLDCFEDIDSKKPENAVAVPNGYPIDSLGSPSEKQPYTILSNSPTDAEISTALNNAYLTGFGTGKAVNLYTEKYIKWYYNQNKGVDDYSRLQIAKRVIEDIVVTTPSVNFGLAVFNRNYDDIGDKDGGRIVSGIKPMTDNHKIDLLNKITSLGPDTNTPLCETLYEAKQYFAGEKLVFGNKDNSATPSRDKLIEINGSYISPYQECQNLAFIVYITDGLPVKDKAADAKVKALQNVNPIPFKWKVGSKRKSSFLPNLSEWMYKHDINSHLSGQQTVKTFTIGFSSGADDAAPVLKAAASLGGGKYFPAYSARELQEALKQVFNEILQVNASFTSPSIASNNFDRTQTFDSVYYAMFLPNKGPRWSGNLKKFKVNETGDIVDQRGNKSIAVNGDLDSSACSFWTPLAVCNAQNNGGDGNEVLIGGAAHTLKNASRNILMNVSVKGNLQPLTLNNAIHVAGSLQHLSNDMGLPGVSENDLDKYFAWAKGIDVDDDDGDRDFSDKREDIIGDPLHSKPLAINLGTKTNKDIRILMGTNHGMLHMFKDSDNSVTESWAFMPYDMLKNLKELRANIPTGVHSVYGIDSPPVAHVETQNGELTRAWVFFGLRRGGSSYYALDITNPDVPKLMWKIDNSQVDFSELGQSWAEPVVTYIPSWPEQNGKINTAKPVLIFGGGYDPSNKDGPAIGGDDTKGNAVFIVDAETGVLVHKFTATAGAKATVIKGIKDSIPNQVAVLDSNNDRLTDRIYATDTGANIWRFDLPSVDRTKWSVFKFAALGGVIDDVKEDRRFFAEPTVAQTKINGIPYDAVAVGSGHRAHPLNLERKDMFFMLQDKYVVSKSYKKSHPDLITINNLKDISLTSNAAVPEYSQKGWVYKFKTQGEKSLAGASIVQGRVFFTSYVPGDTSTSSNQCLAQGEGRLYGFDLHSGKRAFVEKGQDNDNPSKDYISVGSRVPDTPQLVVPSNPNGNDNMYLIGIGNAGELMDKVDKNDGCDPNDNKCIGSGLSTNRIYYHIKE